MENCANILSRSPSTQALLTSSSRRRLRLDEHNDLDLVHALYPDRACVNSSLYLLVTASPIIPSVHRGPSHGGHLCVVDVLIRLIYERLNLGRKDLDLPWKRNWQTILHNGFINGPGRHYRNVTITSTTCLMYS